MKILVTGANGFIGRALCPYLSSIGHDVVPVVRKSYGITNEYIANDELSLRHALKNCNTVVHLAGRAHAFNYQEWDGLDTLASVNVNATLELAHRAIESGVQRFVFMSSIKVNGENTKPGKYFTPDDIPAPQDLYAISKWEAEKGLLKLAQNAQIEIVIIRPPMVYGPGVKGNFASLIRIINKGLPLPFGAVNNKRSMIALDNLVSFTALCADFDASQNAKNQIFLISDGKDVSTKELVKKVANAYDRKCLLLPIPVTWIRKLAWLLGKTDITDRIFGSLRIDDSKVHEITQWSPLVTMDEQLKRMSNAAPF